MTAHINLAKVYSGERGYAIWASNKGAADYLKLAYVQALNIKLTQKHINTVALLTDEDTAKQISIDQRKVFDQIVTLPNSWNFTQTWQVRNLSPWKQTIVTDADLLFTRSIDHWWDWLARWDIYLTSTVEDHRGAEITSRWHREFFDRNLLSNTYTAFYYFKDNLASAEFFDIVRLISEDEDWFGNHLGANPIINVASKTGNKLGDDEIFAIAAGIYGEERCTLPGAAFPRFVHMKEPLLGLPLDRPWHQQLHSEFLPNGLWIGHYPQTLPVHYVNKDWITDDKIAWMERNYRELAASTS